MANGTITFLGSSGPGQRKKRHPRRDKQQTQGIKKTLFLKNSSERSTMIYWLKSESS